MGFKVAIFSLNQWSLDFAGNRTRIIESIKRAHDARAVYRVGPELELCGYSVEDAFFECDMVDHCWQSLKRILDETQALDIIVDVGMPVHFGSLYNCRVIAYKGRILCIRAKTSLANEGNYRERRFFAAWPRKRGIVPFRLPEICLSSSTIREVPFGADFILEIGNHQCSKSVLRLGWEICQELWDIKSTSADLYQDFGCHLVINSSASYWELRKLETVNDMIKGLTAKSGACYAYSNLVGCDGQRIVFYGRSYIYDNGRLKAMTPTDECLFEDIQMISYTVNPDSIDVARALRGIRPDISTMDSKIWHLNNHPDDTSKLTNSHRVLRLDLDANSRQQRDRPDISIDINPKMRFEQEIYHYVSLWLWDYLRRSGMRGFMMPLSGGLDSSTVAVLVYSMCCQLASQKSTHSHLINTMKIPEAELGSAEMICNRILKCSYISTKYSSDATESRARRLCRAIGAEYHCKTIQPIYEQFRQLIGNDPTNQEVSLLEQNLQARLRMVTTYYMSEGNRLVLATGNVDEAIMGYLTKYDCSSADLNPIGGLCKEDLKNFLRFFCATSENDDLKEVLQEIIEAPPSAELTGAEQRDEDEIGLTYDEISVLGKVRRGIYGCANASGAFKIVWRNRHDSLFCNKIRCLRGEMSAKPAESALALGELIKRFYGRYTRNRHKLTVLTPALHTETYSPDDNRFDHRQILYPNMADQFEAVDAMVREIQSTGQLADC